MKLNNLRDKIDGVDEKIIRLLKQRLELAMMIKKEKIHEGKNLVDEVREAEVLHHVTSIARSLHLDEGYIVKLFTIIIKESRRVEKL